MEGYWGRTSFHSGHGDGHPGNILWDPLGPHLLDFDDMMAAPAVQDLWMLFNGDVEEQEAQMDAKEQIGLLQEM